MTDDQLKNINLTEQTTSLQLTLDIFSNHKKRNLALTDNEGDIGFLRNSRLVSFSSMTLDQRRLFDVLLYLASHQIDDDSPYKEYIKKDKKNTYGVDLDFLKWLLHLKNPRNDNLRRLLKNVQSVTFDFQKIDITESDETNNNKKLEWVSFTAFPTIVISTEEKAVFFQINTYFEEVLRNPHLFSRQHFLNLSYIMPDLHSKLLYDWILFHDSEQQEFLIEISFQRLKQELRLDKKTSYKSFGEFNRSVLSPAVEGINKATNLQLEIETVNEKNSKRVGFLIFNVKKTSSKNENEKDLEAFFEQYNALKNTFGLQQKHIEEILKNQWGAERIDNARNYVLVQIKRGIKIKSVSAYFMNVIRNDYQAGALDLALLYDDPSKAQEVIDREVRELMNQPNQTESNVAALEELAAQSPQVSDSEALPSKENSGKEKWDAFLKMPYVEQIELMELFMQDPYVQFNISAGKIKVDEPGSLFSFVLDHANINQRFIDFLVRRIA